MDKQDKELEFVLRHYREGVFDPDVAMKRMGITRQRPLLRRRWVAAAASLLSITVLASILVWQAGLLPSFTDHSSPAETKPSTESMAEVSFDFDDTPLPEVLDRLGRYYDVKLTANDSTRHLTGHFKTKDLEQIVNMIEEVLQVQINVEPQTELSSDESATFMR